MGNTGDVTRFDPKPPAAPPPAPGPATATKQEYQIAVPFGKTTLAMGVSAGRGGSGASLTTSGSVLIDTCGPMDLQSVGAMAAQTLGSLAVMSLTGTMVGTVGAVQVSAGAMIKVWAGAGKAPGACGTGSAGGAPEAPEKSNEGGPAGDVEKRVNKAVAPAALASSMAGVAAAKGMMKIVAGVAGMANAAVAGQEAAEGKEPSTKLKAANDALSSLAEGNYGGIAAAIGGGVAASGGGPGGGATKVDIQGPSGIHMTTVSKITGGAANAIEFKAGFSWGAKAAAGVELQASGVSIFSIGKVYMRGIGKTEVTSMVIVEMGAPVTKFASGKFSASGLAEFKMKGGKFLGVFGASADFTSAMVTFSNDVKMSGKLHQRDRMWVKGKKLVKKDLKVMKDMLGKGDAKLEASIEAGKGKTKQVSVTGALTT